MDDAFIDQLAQQGIAYTPFFPLGGFSPLQSSALESTATALNATPLQVALAWLLQRNILLIPGTSSVDHLRENLKAAEIQLPPQAVKYLNAIAAQHFPYLSLLVIDSYLRLILSAITTVYRFHHRFTDLIVNNKIYKSLFMADFGLIVNCTDAKPLEKHLDIMSSLHRLPIAGRDETCPVIRMLVFGIL
jgi:Aldo/keto reductase family